MIHQHFIMTLFNIKLGYKPGHKGRDGKTLQSGDWFNQRCNLFEKYCLPSVQRQTSQDFTWLIFCGLDTTKKQWERLNQYRAAYPKILYLQTSLRRFDIGILLADLIHSNTNVVITTRLDNDDALNVRMVYFLHKHIDEFRASRDKSMPVNFPNGLVLDLRKNKLYAKGNNKNSFASLFERPHGVNKEVRSIMATQHANIGEFGDIGQIPGLPDAWLQIIHDRNIANTPQGVELNLSQLKKQFGFEYETKVAVHK